MVGTAGCSLNTLLCYVAPRGFALLLTLGVINVGKTLHLQMEHGCSHENLEVDVSCYLCLGCCTWEPQRVVDEALPFFFNGLDLCLGGLAVVEPAFVAHHAGAHREELLAIFWSKLR